MLENECRRPGHSGCGEDRPSHCPKPRSCRLVVRPPSVDALPPEPFWTPGAGHGAESESAGAGLGAAPVPGRPAKPARLVGAASARSSRTAFERRRRAVEPRPSLVAQQRPERAAAARVVRVDPRDLGRREERRLDHLGLPHRPVCLFVCLRRCAALLAKRRPSQLGIALRACGRVREQRPTGVGAGVRACARVCRCHACARVGAAALAPGRVRRSSSRTRGTRSVRRSSRARRRP